MRQSEDVLRLEREAEDLHQQNAQLLISFQQFKMELEMTNGENQTLQETLNMYEMNLEKATDQNAQLSGHANPKQKIRHMVNLKEENKELREQLKKASQRITQLGVSRKGEGLLEALASFSHAHGLGHDQLSVAPSTCGRSVAETPGPATSKGGVDKTPKRPGTPTRKAPLSARGARNPRSEAEEQMRREDEERRLQMQERAVERVQTDFQHFIALIERACGLEDSSPNPAALLERLRTVVNAPRGQGELQMTPRAELTYPDEHEAEEDEM